MVKGLIVDTNLLLLIIIGMLEDGRHIKNSDRLNKFSKKDLDLTLGVIKEYEYCYGQGSTGITPYIATEVSNLIDLKGDLRAEAFTAAKVIFSGMTEIIVELKQDIQNRAFLTHGITDTSLIELVKDYVVLTDDNRMLSLLYEANKDNVLPFAIVGQRY